MKDRADIETRYEQFRCMELPWQPMMAHMWTDYLLNDLHAALIDAEAERDRLIEALRAIENTPPTKIRESVAVESHGSWWKRLVIDMRDQARAALQEGEG